jgi:type I restriction enzyme S subunit
VSQPARFKRVYAQPAEAAVPYLRPYDVFDYMPIPADHLSDRGTDRIRDLMITQGSLILPASGRNLGPAVAVDAYMEQFALSHDAIRITPHQTADMPYLLAFINSAIGQALIRRNITGSVIDHIGLQDLASIPVPILPDNRRESVQTLMSASIRTRELARLNLASLSAELARAIEPLARIQPAAGWTVSAGTIGERFDAAAIDPRVTQAADILRGIGGVRLDSIADVVKPASRYKAYHVDSQHGRPFLTGGQLGQATVIAPKFMADRVFADPEKYKLTLGEVAFPADGRAEEGLGVPTVVTSDRHGWLASEHVMRLRPRPGVHAGWLYLVMTLPHVQVQIRALARGSVVDTLYERDVAGVIVPPIDARLGEAVDTAWEDFALAHSLEQRAMLLFEAIMNDDPEMLRDLLITVREAAAIRSTSVDDVAYLIGEGKLPAVGGADAHDALLSLNDVLGLDDTSADAISSVGRTALKRRAAAYGYVTAVMQEAFEALVSDEPDGPGRVLQLPKSAIRDQGEASRLRAGDKFVWWLMPDPDNAQRVSALDRSVIKVIPRSVLTSDEVGESYLWADAFARQHLRLRDESDDD